MDEEYNYQKKRKMMSMLMGLIIINAEESERKRGKREWVKPYLLRREQYGIHHNLFLELSLEDPMKFRRCLRMDVDSFQFLLDGVKPYIQKQDTNMRKSIPADERLSVTLRYLATGETLNSLHFTFRIGESTICGIIREVCYAIIKFLKADYVKIPATEAEWRVVANEFGNLWNFQNCLFAMDGKHVKIDPPVNSGSLYFNYKSDFSVVLLAAIDANLRFMWVDVGTNGRISDTGVWNKSSLKQQLEKNTLQIPPPEPLPGTNITFPFVAVGDEGFPLTRNILIPYPGVQCAERNDRRIFNYRLSRARRVSENAFGVLGARFQIYRAPMRHDPHIVQSIVMATICLHNWLRSQSIGKAMYTPPGFVDNEDVLMGQLIQGDWRHEVSQGFVNFCPQGGNRHANKALALRDSWCEYFNGAGDVPWQNKMIQ